MKKQILKLLVVILTVFSYNSQAQTTYIVTNTNNSGPGSLRDIAISVVSGDTIRFSSSLLTAAVDSISLLTDIYFDSRGVVIKGLYTATDTLYISGGNIARIFTFNGAGKVVLDSLVLINGNGIGALSYGVGGISSNGGAVLYYEGTDTIHVDNSIFRGNTASFAGGLSAYAYSYFDTDDPSVEVTHKSIVTVSNSKFIENTAYYGRGGGVCSYSVENISSVTVDNSIFSGNTAGGDSGGGVYSFSNMSSYSFSSIVKISNSTFIGNTTNNDGGGIYSYAATASCSVTVSNSTFSGNTASTGGGVSSEASYSSSVAVNKSTFSGNTASEGGGIYSNSFSYSFSSSSVAVNNSTFSGNTASQEGGGVYSYCSSNISNVKLISSIFDGSNISNQYTNHITSNGHNAFSDSPTGTVGTDYKNVNLNLFPLAFNGGSTQTMLPNPVSIAIDTGNPSDITDAQNQPIVGVRDIGAAESSYAIKKTIASDCESYTWDYDGNTYTTDTSSYYIVQGVGVNGTDSAYVLDLSINANTGDTTVYACENFTWYGTNYTASTTPTHLFTNVAGCDSTVTLHLMISHPETADTTAIACDQFNWYGTNFTSSATATQLLHNIGGCDSLVTLHLTVNYSTTSDTIVTECDDFTWFGTKYTSSNDYTHVLINKIGCDSIITLHLTINTVDTTVTQTGAIFSSNAIGATYKWLDCNNGYTLISGETNQTFVPSSNDSYAVEVTQNGCVDTSACYTRIIAGINDYTQSTYKLYPNPVKNELTIENQGDINQIEVYNVMGQLLQASKPQSTMIKLDFSVYEQGTYLVKIHTTDGQVATSRVVKAY